MIHFYHGKTPQMVDFLAPLSAMGWRLPANLSSIVLVKVGKIGNREPPWTGGFTMVKVVNFQTVSFGILYEFSEFVVWLLIFKLRLSL